MSTSWPMCWSAPCCRSASRRCWRWRRPRSSGLSHRRLRRHWRSAFWSPASSHRGWRRGLLPHRKWLRASIIPLGTCQRCWRWSMRLSCESAVGCRVLSPESQLRQRDWGDAIDAAARPAAFAAAIPTAASRGQRAGRRGGRNWAGGHGRTHHVSHLDAVAAVGVRGDDSVARRRHPVDPVAVGGTTSARPDVGEQHCAGRGSRTDFGDSATTSITNRSAAGP